MTPTPLTLNFYPIRLRSGAVMIAFFDGANFFANGKMVGHHASTDPLADYCPIAVAPTPSGVPASPIADSDWVSCDDIYNHPSMHFEDVPFMRHADKTHPDVVYLNQALDILRYGQYSGNRTDTDTITINSSHANLDFRKGAPLLTTKFMAPKNVFEETKWMLSGEGNIAPLKANGCNIWNGWANAQGDLGPVYGVQWRHWTDRRLVNKQGPELDSAEIAATLRQMRERGFVCEYENNDIAVMIREIDQVQNVIDALKNNPTDRRMMITGLNPSFTPYGDLSPSENADIGQQALPPCHVLYHFLTSPIPHADRLAIAGQEQATADELDAAGVPAYYLDMNLYQRSADFFLGAPYNRYSSHCMMGFFGHIANMVPRYFDHTTGSTHFYVNHIEQILTQMAQPVGEIPQSTISVTSLENITQATVSVTGYTPGIKLKGAVAI